MPSISDENEDLATQPTVSTPQHSCSVEMDADKPMPFESEVFTPSRRKVSRKRLMGPSDEEVRAEQLTCLKKWARNLDLEYELLLEKKRRIQGIQAVQSGDRSANS